ncbi:relaxase/mobilization nuclease domain-containing protein [Novosphingobium subterraneum]|uniref:relaxase/mobilization nuclease domain-containing protein n=1 Tax=Novosphingobium subterraneum TaxID=48936 RepID=UPI0010F97150
MSDDDFQIRPGKGRSRGSGSGKRAQSFIGQVVSYSMKGGHRLARSRHSGTGRTARGRRAGLAARSRAASRRVIVKARVVRHKGARFRAAPLARHIAYLKRDGVTRDGKDAGLFDARSDAADGDAFAGRCEEDRHHFRFIVSPEDAAELEDIRAFTRELMDDMAHDLDTRLDWVAVDHWNTDNPHVHILVRGRAEDGQDIVIDRDYIRAGLRSRAEERVTVELGPRSEREIARAIARDVDAERWTGLDRSLQRMADDNGGVVDLRPNPSGYNRADHNHLLGRAAKLERLGLAECVSPACWTLKPGIEQTLRDLSIRGDIIKTMHRAMSAGGLHPDAGRFALHNALAADPVIGRLVERGLHDELSGSAYAVVDATDGRTHYLRFSDIDQTSDAKPGAIVELGQWRDNRGNDRQSLAVRSDLSLAEQVQAPGATWLDRQLVSREPVETAGGFGTEVRDALAARSGHLASEGLARRQGQRFVFARDLLDELQTRELRDAANRISARSGLEHTPAQPGDHLAGIYRERVTLSSGRFAMIDDGTGFQLVPWRPSLERHLGQAVAGTINARGGVDWSFTRSRTLGL